MELLRLVIIGLMGITLLAVGVAVARRGEPPGDRERLDKLFTAGNYKDAYEGYRRLALDPKAEPRSRRRRPDPGDRVPREARPGR